MLQSQHVVVIRRSVLSKAFHVYLQVGEQQ